MVHIDMLRQLGARQKRRTKPSHYPFFSFHALRSAQLISSAVVMSITAFFMWHLRHDRYSLPWTFILLQAVSVFTIIALAVTIVLHILHGLNPRVNLFVNGSLLLLWTVSFALLTWWSLATVDHACDVLRWKNSKGIMICRMYKALFAFSCVGFASTAAALTLDVIVYRRSARRGVYNQMDSLESDIPQPLDAKLPSTTTNAVGVSNTDLPRQNGHSIDGNWRAIELRGVTSPSPARGGYGVPEEQFSYDAGAGYFSGRTAGRW